MSAGPFPPDPPLIAILRGVDPSGAREVGSALYEAGFRALEVPLNRPGALESITALARSLPADCLLGAGTVLTSLAVEEVAARGAQLIVAPNCDAEVIACALKLGLFALPGVATPTEGLGAMRLGAHGLKAFPAEALPPAVIRSWRSVIAATMPIFPVGGITPEAMAEFHAAGASGFGIGSQLFQPAFSNAELAGRARAFVAAWSAICASRQPA